MTREFYLDNLDLITEWSTGAKVQYRFSHYPNKWKTIDKPSWDNYYEYRLKPKKKKSTTIEGRSIQNSILRPQSIYLVPDVNNNFKFGKFLYFHGGIAYFKILKKF